jgi:hypothetical protein
MAFSLKKSVSLKKKSLIKVIFIFLVGIKSAFSQSATGTSLGAYGDLFTGVQIQSETYGLRSNTSTNRNQPGVNVFVTYESPYKVYLFDSIRQNASDKNASGAHYKYENCIAPGFKDVFFLVQVDLSYQSCMRDHGPSSNISSYYQAKFQYGSDENLAFYFYTYLDDTGANRSTINSIKYEYQKYGINPGINYNFGPFIGNVDYLRWNNYSKTYSVGVSKDLFGTNLELAAHKTMLDKWVTWNQTDLDNRTFLVLTATKRF